MKRKVIKLGMNSLLVSLPSDWVKKHGIKKGDELSIEEKEDKLILQNASTPTGTKTMIDITNLRPIVKRALSALYKKGYDEFTVHFEDNDELELAYEIVREEFIGFEVVQHGKNHLVVREVSQPHGDQFETMLRRQFLIIKDFAHEIATALTSKDHDWLKRLVLRDKDVNKIADFCRRLINKEKGKQPSTGMYFIVEQLEKISDRYRDISAFAAEQKLVPSKLLLQAYNNANAYLDLFYQCFYQFSLPTTSAFVAKRKELIAQLEKSHQRATFEERRILFWLEDIVEKLFDLNGPLMLLHL